MTTTGVTIGINLEQFVVHRGGGVSCRNKACLDFGTFYQDPYSRNRRTANVAPCVPKRALLEYILAGDNDSSVIPRAPRNPEIQPSFVSPGDTRAVFTKKLME